MVERIRFKYDFEGYPISLSNYRFSIVYQIIQFGVYAMMNRYVNDAH